MPEPGSTTTSGGDAPVRVRIAPSPTGDPHVGTAYIGLFNFAFARKHGGQFILRIEDTDRGRSTEGSERAILEALRWVGLDWDEGPDVGGPVGPYRQSERLDIYREAVDQLLDNGRAYRCFCTRARLDELREQQRAEQKRRKQDGDKTPVRLGYDGHCRGLDAGDAARRTETGEEHVVRLAIPREGTTSFFDALAEDTITIENAQIDDQVLFKSDGFPTYHLANVVDDHYMGITHVIRGEEWINSTPKHVLLYAAFGWEMPRFYHLGLLRNADRSKLSKRKNPVSIFHYRDLGYLPQTFTNFLANLGYSYGGDIERFTLEQWIENFDWSRVSRGGPVFDSKKLDAFSGDDIRALAPEALLSAIQERVLDRERLLGLLEQAQPRIERLDDFIPYVSCFFGATLDYGPVLESFRVKNRSRKEVVGILGTYLAEIETESRARAFEAEGLEAFTRDFCARQDWKPKELLPLLRLAATARKATPPLFETLHLCGKDRVRMRIRALIATLRAGPDW